jgi:uncharacterized protein YjbI with pentapeptide repeats
LESNDITDAELDGTEWEGTELENVDFSKTIIKNDSLFLNI